MNDSATAQILADPQIKRADLHCHSRYSIFKYFRRANTRDCYNAPEDVYRIAKERGMSYVTLTDHDSIDGALYLLNKNPDTTFAFQSYGWEIGRLNGTEVAVIRFRLAGNTGLSFSVPCEQIPFLIEALNGVANAAAQVKSDLVTLQ